MPTISALDIFIKKRDIKNRLPKASQIIFYESWVRYKLNIIYQIDSIFCYSISLFYCDINLWWLVLVTGRVAGWLLDPIHHLYIKFLTITNIKLKDYEWTPTKIGKIVIFNQIDG